MGAPRPACADAWAGRAFAHNDLRSAAGELSGGDESATLRVNSVLLHYLPAAGWKCPTRRQKGGNVALALFGLKAGRIGGIEQNAARGHRHVSMRTMPTTTFASRPVPRLAGASQYSPLLVTYATR